MTIPISNGQPHHLSPAPAPVADPNEVDAFLELYGLLKRKVGRAKTNAYRVPGFLLGQGNSTHLLDVGDPYLFYADVCDRILDGACESRGCSEVSGLGDEDVVYLSFIRSFAALNGRIGTALSQIAFLLFIRNALGASIFLSLPTGVMGRTNRRGKRGSPFALADPFGTDPSLGDPLIPEISPQGQYRALTQACRLLGMRAGSIVPMATLSIDSPLIRDCPDLAFWWESDPGEPLSTLPFDVTSPAATPRFLPREPTVTRNRFFDPPLPPASERCDADGVFLISHVEGGRLVTVANAFTDVHPEDSDYAIWPDVAMLNYTSVRYPYFAGARTESIFDASRPAYSFMERVLEWRHATFGESVFLVDLGANVPSDVLHGARSRITQAGGSVTFIGEELWSFDAQNDGVDAVVGPLPYCVSAHTHNPMVLVESLRHHLQELQRRNRQNRYLAGLANHDTMPVLPEYAALLCTCYSFLPGAVPLVFSGSEWHAQTITNPEFGLSTTKQLRTLRQTLRHDVRALFNDVPLAWEEVPRRARDGQACAYLPALYGELAHMRAKLGIDNSWTYSFWIPDAFYQDCFGYLRESRMHNARIGLAINWGRDAAELQVPSDSATTLELSHSGLRKLSEIGDRITVHPQRGVVFMNSSDP